MAKHRLWESSLYTVYDITGRKHVIDVTQSISPGLKPNQGFIDHLVPWMNERGFTRVLDFGAGALRHTLALLNAGIDVTIVEYKRAFTRPKASENLKIARSKSGYTSLIWPINFISSPKKYDVALLLYVLQVIPVETERLRILKEIAKKLDKNGPRRLYYASRHGEAKGLPNNRKCENGGWIKGDGDGKTFYIEWNASKTDDFMKKAKFARAGTYIGASQPFIYEINGL
jgi:SAM-dependent methyltransferase